jgi:hypothetical protein
LPAKCARYGWSLSYCAVSELDINFDRAPPPPHSSAPVRQERGYFLTVLSDVPPHFSFARSVYSLHPLSISPSNDRNDNIRAHSLFSFCAALLMLSYLHSVYSWRSIPLNKAIYTRSVPWPTKLHCVDELCRRSRWNIIPWFRRFSSSCAVSVEQASRLPWQHL